MRGLLVVVLVAGLAPALARADVVHLTGGGQLEGQVVEERADAVVMEVSAGRITLPRTRIARLVRGTSALAGFRARAAALADGDIGGWLALGEWARDHDLLTQSRAAFEHVLARDPMNAAAHRALGHVLVAGRWMTLEDSYRARGLVQFEGSWVTPEERQALFSERAADEAQRRDRLEAEARIREAEARARAAEAEARRVEAEQQAAEGGIPFPYLLGGGFGPVFPAEIVPVEPPPPAVVVVQVPAQGRQERPHKPVRTKASSSSRAVRKDANDTRRPPRGR